ncbi:MAG: hypothetical protein QNJ53_14055 [Pleurocapsa sp. MO_192.B19]|nr:hypothetical protein [Pleurocapsa sp. MO_192.B19]
MENPKQIPLVHAGSSGFLMSTALETAFLIKQIDTLSLQPNHIYRYIACTDTAGIFT